MAYINIVHLELQSQGLSTELNYKLWKYQYFSTININTKINIYIITEY